MAPADSLSGLRAARGGRVGAAGGSGYSRGRGGGAEGGAGRPGGAATLKGTSWPSRCREYPAAAGLGSADPGPPGRWQRPGHGLLGGWHPPNPWTPNETWTWSLHPGQLGTRPAGAGLTGSPRERRGHAETLCPAIFLSLQAMPLAGTQIPLRLSLRMFKMSPRWSVCEVRTQMCFSEAGLTWEHKGFVSASQTLSCYFQGHEFAQPARLPVGN
ncbi:uncharacterized protein LOC130683640 [Manis pentadactyla]|uniref:uncharacterized protein LOC130683640 n=1 Tax=Manis pentadactyla TaxID=143292 RepID=UPI00255CE0CE|nr:uncharacterized protein LOC130683640 [Manis pentadactyla]